MSSNSMKTDNYQQRSISNDPMSIKSNLIIESDLILDNLDNIIDLHSNSNLNEIQTKPANKNALTKKSESFKKSNHILINFKKLNEHSTATSTQPSSPSSSNVNNHQLLQKALSTNLDHHHQQDQECPVLIQTITKKDKFKSKSYLINSSSQRKSLSSENHHKFTENSNTNQTVSTSPPQQTTTSTNLKRFLFSNSSSNTISGIKTKKLSSIAVAQQVPNQYSTATTTCFLNNSKKKRSSLFNLFSFSKSTTSNSQANTNLTNQSVQNLNTIVNDTTSMNLADTENQDDDNVFIDLSPVPPPPEEFADQPTKQRPYSEVVSSPEWHRNFKFFLNKRTYKISNSKSDKSDTKSENRSEKSSLLSFKSNDCSSPVEKDVKISKKLSIRSKGFSIPLNASYCPNSLPINCVQEHFNLLNNNNNNNNNNSNNHYQSEEEQTLDLYEDINENYRDDDAKIKDFDLVEENSCLKEVNLRLKYAEIKNLDDEFNDENSDLKETNLTIQNETFETLKSNNQDSNEGQDQLNKSNNQQNNDNNEDLEEELNVEEENDEDEEDEDNYEDEDIDKFQLKSQYSTISPTPSILTLSLNNQCSTATTALNDNLNSINFVDNLNLNMFSQQNRSKTNISKIMVNYKQENNDQENNSNESNNNNQALSTKKKRFQQFQTQSLINLNGLKRNSRNLENSNDLPTTSTNTPLTSSTTQTTSQQKQSLNSSFRSNNIYDTIEETANSHYNLVQASLSSPSSLLNNDQIAISIQILPKPIYQTVQLRKGFKLRDILKPVLADLNMSIDDFDVFKKNSLNNESEDSIELSSSCETYSGYELYLKKKFQKGIEKNTKLRKSSLQIQNSTDNLPDELKLNSLNDNASHSSLNWQNYFNNPKSKEKNNKHKRNSCIAVMNGFDTNTSSSINSGSHSSSSGQATYNLTNSSSTSITSNMRDSFQSFVYSNTLNMSPGERIPLRPPTRNFRRIAQISSIFTGYGQQQRAEPANSKLNDQLNIYLRDLPKLPDELNVKSFDTSILDIESDWNKFVGESFAQSLPTKIAKQQMAIWELLATECSHIKTIKIIIDVFLSCLINLKCSEQTCEMFKDIDIKRLFSNIIDVFNCNLTFWQRYLSPIITNLHANMIIDPSVLVKAFSEFKTLFSPYEEFILERNNSIEYFKQKLTENENFAKFIAWAEIHPQVGRLKISDFMMIPVQRVTKYQLLIENIYQHTEEETKREKISLIRLTLVTNACSNTQMFGLYLGIWVLEHALVSKKEWVNSLPNTINIKLNYLAQFKEISESIEKYEGITSPNDEISEMLNSFKKFDIKSPLPGCSKTSIRELIHQGPLKLKELPKSLDVHCFLFTDMLLITQQKKTKKYKIIKPPVSTSRMIVKELTQTDKAFVVLSMNDYNVPDSVSMFISNQSKKWIEFLELSKKKYLSELEKHKNSISLQQLFNFDNSETIISNNNRNKETSTSSGVSSPLQIKKSLVNESNSIILEDPNSNNNNQSDDSNETSTDPVTTNDSEQQTTLKQSNNSEFIKSPTNSLNNTRPTSPQNQLSINEIEPTRRDSSATLTLPDNLSINDQKESENSSDFLNNKNSQLIKSPILGKRMQKSPPHQHQYQKQTSNSSINSSARLLDRRIERQRRNMTDPNQHSTDERHCIIPKRNSLNDRSNTKMQPIHHPSKLTNFYGDSTSTILSTDSGVSNCDNQISYSQESITKTTQLNGNSVQSPTRIINPLLKNVLSPSSPTSSSYSNSSNDPIYSNLSISSSSSSNCSAKNDSFNNKKIYCPEDEYVDEEVHVTGNNNLEEGELNEFQLEPTPFANVYENPSLILKKITNQRMKPNTIENYKMKTNYDLNNNQTSMFLSNSNYYDYVHRTNEDDLINKNETQKLIIPNTPLSPTGTSTSNNNGTTSGGIYQKSQSVESARIGLKKPLIKKPTTVKNESVRVKPELILTNDLCSESTKNLNFDSTIDSAHLNFNSNNSNSNNNNNNGLTLDNHHRMILVNLLHTTLDATEV